MKKLLGMGLLMAIGPATLAGDSDTKTRIICKSSVLGLDQAQEQINDILEKGKYTDSRGKSFALYSMKISSVSVSETESASTICISVNVAPDMK